MRAYFLYGPGADALDGCQVIDPLEGTVGLAIGHDSCRCLRPDPGKTDQLLGRRRVEVDPVRLCGLGRIRRQDLGNGYGSLPNFEIFDA